jgi:signal transduction histidine kinase/CheY-like chemotaxis protein
MPSCKAGGLTYALAMLLADAAAALTPPPRVTVFGTDEDEEALAVARVGRYTARAALGMDPELRGRYTIDEGETIRISEKLREMCIFARHELGHDPPMLRMDLVVCVHLFDGVPEDQREQLVEVLHYSLAEGGVLLALDNAEVFPEDRFERLDEGYLRARRSPRKPKRPSPFGAPLDPSEKLPRWTHLESQDGRVNLEPFIHSIGLPLVLCDSALRVLFVSNDAKVAFGLSEVDVGADLGTLLAALPGDAQLLRAAQRVVQYKLTQELSIRQRRRSYLARISAAAPGIAIVFTDVSAVDAARAHAIAQRHQHAAIARMSEAALLVTEPGELYEQALAVLFGNIATCSGGLIVEVAPDGAGFDVAASRGLGNEPLQMLLAMGDPARVLERVLLRGRKASDEPAPPPVVEPVAAADSPSPFSARPEALIAAPPQAGLVPVEGGVACPVLDDDRCVLAVVILFARGRTRDAGEYRHFLQAVANVLGSALVRLRTRFRLTLELEISRLMSGAPDLATLGPALAGPLGGALGCDGVELWSLAEDDPQLLFPSRQTPNEFVPPRHCDDIAWERHGTALVIVVPLPPRHPRGRFCLRLRGAALREPDRELREGLSRIGGMLADFLERQRILELSRQSEAALREADRQKDDFLAMLAHELRNPMAAIRNATELLARVEQPTPQLSRLQSIFDRQTLQTTTLIDGLLDVARVARGKVELHVTPVELRALVRQVLDDRRQQFRERELDVTLPDRDVWTLADRVRLVQVLDNLISNALKFTAAGGRIGVRLECSDGRGCLYIEDDGQGIEPQLLPRIFEPFRQGRASGVGAQGLGLGLALVKGLLELHGFEIRAESQGLGRGARFSIAFPTTAAPDAPAPTSEVAVGRLDLLVVEDNPDIAETLAELLAVAGHRVDRVESAEAALVALGVHQPDVLLCDIGLPGMDGLALAARLRQDERFHALKLVAMTGFGDASTRRRVEEAGFDRMLIKPVGMAALSQCLARVAASSRVSRG